MARADFFFYIKSRARNTPELKIRRKIARTLEWVKAILNFGEMKWMVQKTPWNFFETITEICL